MCMRAPEIRFKQYKEKWGSIVLKEIGQTYSGLTGKVKEDFGIGNGLYIPFLNVLVNPQIDISNLQKVKIRFDEKQNKVHKGDILFNTSSETPEEVGLCSVFTSDIENVYLNSFCFGFRLTNSLINSSYIVYLLRSSLGRELMMILAQGATRYNLSKKSFLDSQIRIPESLQEQQKIASYFQKLDSLIQSTSKKLASLEQIKAASLQSMFPQEGETVPKVRFKGFEEGWEKEKLGNLFKERIENNINGELLSVTINNGIIKASDNGRFDNSNNDKSHYKVVKIGDIVYNTMRMWQGASGYSAYEGIVSPAYTVIIPQEQVFPLFFAYLFKTQSLINRFRIHSQGLTTDTWNLKFAGFSIIEVCFPKSKLEQQK